MKKNDSSVIYALITIILWGTVATSSKLLLNNITSYQLMFYVALFSTLSILVIFLLSKEQKNILSDFKKNWKYLIILGVLSMGLQQLFYFLSLDNAPVAQITVINYTWPIFTLILSVLILKEKPSWRTYLAFILGLIGVYIVITRGTFLTFETKYLFGYILGLAGSFIWALFSVLNKKINVSPIKSTLIYNLVGLLFMIFVMLFTKSSFLIPLNETLGTFYIGLFPTAIAFAIWLKAIKIGKATIIANLANLTPFISLLFIGLIIKEPILISEVIGLIIIVAGIILQFTKK